MHNRKTVKEVKLMKGEGRKITVLTAYDASMAALLHSCGVDMLLVGDSLGMVVLGYDSTIPVTMDEMLHHCAAVRRGAPGAFVTADMPFGSYQQGEGSAVRNGIRFLKEAGADAVKLEGGLEICGTVETLVKAGIPVMGHIGLTPQTASQVGGYKLQGKDLGSAEKLLIEARALEKAGVFAVVLECMPAKLAEVISSSLSIATIGIGAGAGCDGQVLVINDMLGMFEKFFPRFVKQYAQIAPTMKNAVNSYLEEVRSGAFPDESQSFSVDCDYASLMEK